MRAIREAKGGSGSGRATGGCGVVGGGWSVGRVREVDGAEPSRGSESWWERVSGVRVLRGWRWRKVDGEMGRDHQRLRRRCGVRWLVGTCGAGVVLGCS
jgi:hypothetical protein